MPTVAEQIASAESRLRDASNRSEVALRRAEALISVNETSSDALEAFAHASTLAEQAEAAWDELVELRRSEEVL